MSANFKAGEVLTAARLNDAINSILPGRRSTVAPGVQASVRQNAAPAPVVEPERPVYLDKASMLLAAGEPEGWYVQQAGERVHLSKVKNNAAVYLVISTDALGQETAREWTSTPPPAFPWDPVRGESGKEVYHMGHTAENPFVKSGSGSSRFLFYPVGSTRVQPEPKNYSVSCDLPDGWKEFPLLLQPQGNTRPVRAIQSGGGLLEVEPAVNSANRYPLSLAPRVSFFPLNEDACAPATGYFENPCTLRLGEWQILAGLKIGGQEVQLKGFWETPWRVGLAFAPAAVELSGGAAEKMTWQGAARPVVGQNPHGLGPWKRVSYTPGVTVIKTPGQPIDCNYEIYDFAVYEAPGTFAPDSAAMQRVLWVAQMRRQKYPKILEWEQFNKAELTCCLS